MRSKKSRRGGGRPPAVDPSFADALTAGESCSDRFEKPDYKSKQLCRQVYRSLSLSLAGELGDPILAEVDVVDVLAPAGAGHLIVQVTVPVDHSIDAVMSRLDRATPRLRALVAASITRKRAPMLTFVPFVGGAQ